MNIVTPETGHERANARTPCHAKGRSHKPSIDEGSQTTVSVRYLQFSCEMCSHTAASAILFNINYSTCLVPTLIHLPMGSLADCYDTILNTHARYQISVYCGLPFIRSRSLQSTNTNRVIYNPPPLERCTQTDASFYCDGALQQRPISSCLNRPPASNARM